METTTQGIKRVEIPYYPHGGQLKFHNSDKKFRAIISGVAFGKTAAGANEMLKMAFQHPESLHCIIAPNAKIMKNATLPEIWKFGRKLISYERKTDNVLFLINGAKIVCVTADNQRHVDRLRGMTIGSFWADEAALLLKSVWDVILARLRSQKGPLKGVITTTPRGYNWLYWYFVKKRDPQTRKKLHNADQFEWFGGTTHDNPYTPEEFKQTLEDSYTGMFREQEIYGKFVGFEGQVYNNFDINKHIIKKEDVPELSEYIFGVDWGFTNPMAAVIIGFDSDGRAYILEEFYKKKVQVEDVIKWVKRKHEVYNFSRGYGDPSEPQFIQKFNRSQLPMSQADNQVLPGINRVYDMLSVREDGRPRLYVVNTCEWTIDEFNMYRYKEVREGMSQKEEPLKVQDHLMDAVRYALKSHTPNDNEYLILDDPEGMVL